MERAGQRERRVPVIPQTIGYRVVLGFTVSSLVACAGGSGRAAVEPPSPPIGIAPFELHNAHVYVQVEVGDSVFGWFILDTGGSTTLDAGTANALGRPIVRTDTGAGGGEAPFVVRYMDGVQLRLVDAARHSVAIVPAQRVATIDLSAVARGEGRPVGGILGGSFFARHAVVIDYDRGQVEIHRSRDFRGRDGWIAVPLRIQGDLAFARGTATLRPGEEPIPGWYNIDSGGGHALILNAPFVSRQGLVAPEGASTDAMFGLGGGARAWPGRAPAFRIGGVTMTDVATLFSQARSGFFSSDDFHGSIGGGLLTRFSGVAFDYGSKRMWLGQLKARQLLRPNDH